MFAWGNHGGLAFLAIEVGLYGLFAVKFIDFGSFVCFAGLCFFILTEVINAISSLNLDILHGWGYDIIAIGSCGIGICVHLTIIFTNNRRRMSGLLISSVRKKDYRKVAKLIPMCDDVLKLDANSQYENYQLMCDKTELNKLIYNIALGNDLDMIKLFIQNDNMFANGVCDVLLREEVGDIGGKHWDTMNLLATKGHRVDYMLQMAALKLKRAEIVEFLLGYEIPDTCNLLQLAYGSLICDEKVSCVIVRHLSLQRRLCRDELLSLCFPSVLTDLVIDYL